MQTINLYMHGTKLGNVCGRVDYISNPERQKEKLIAAVGQQDPEYWCQLAADCQASFKGQKRMIRGALQDDICIEGRELIISLPNVIGKLPDDVLRQKLESLHELLCMLTGTDGALALHNSKAMESGDEPGNFHAHFVFSERQRLLEPEVKVAERNLFFDAAGKRCYKKADVMENGQLRPGCTIVPKGTVLQERYFGAKNPELKTQEWMYQAKLSVADWINQELQPDLQRVVYDAETSLTIPTFHVGKGLPAEKEARLRRANEVIKRYNKLVRRGDIDPKEAERNKTLVMLSPDREVEVQNLERHWQQKMNPEYHFADQTAFTPRTTNRDPEKEKLRKLYRDVAEARNISRDRSRPLGERTQATERARWLSAEIDRRRKQLGLMQIQDYERNIARKKKEKHYLWEKIRKLDRSLRRTRDRREWSIDRDIESIEEIIRKENQRIFPNYGLIALYQKDIQELEDRRAAIRAEFKAAQEELREEREAAAWQYAAIKADLKREKKELKQKRKEPQKHPKRKEPTR